MQEMRYILDLTRPYDNLLATEGAQNQSFVWGNELLSASGESNFHYLQDHLGSPVRLVGADVDEALAFDEFGVPLVGANNIHQPFGFTGYQTDNISGLYYAQARYFSAENARFISEDYVRDGVNWYVHCYNNPLIFVDRNGLWGQDVHEGSGGSDYGTYTWASSLGMPDDIARDIARHNYGTDSGSTGPMPWQDQSYHFNRNTDGTDSRQEHADKNLQRAIDLWNKANELEKQPNDKYSKYRDAGIAAIREQALKLLGQGLHALQDIQAHGRIGIYDGWWASHVDMMEIDDIRFDWGDSSLTWVKESDEQFRLKMTELFTLMYLAEFIAGVGRECEG